MWWLEIAKFDSLIVLEAKSPKPRFQQGRALSKGSREDLSFLISSSPAGSRRLLACGCICPISVSIFMWLPFLCLCVPFPSLMRTPAIGFRGRLNLGWSHLVNFNLIESAMTLFLNKLTLWGSAWTWIVRRLCFRWTWILGRHYLVHYVNNLKTLR